MIFNIIWIFLTIIIIYYLINIDKLIRIIQKVIKSELQKKMLEQKKEYEQLYSQFKVVMDDIDNFDSFNDCSLRCAS